MFVAELEAERKSRRMSQAEFACKLGFTDRAYRAYVCEERRMQLETMNGIAGTLKSPRLAWAALSENRNPFAPVLLDVDDHPAQEFCAAVEELREAVGAVERLEMCRPDRVAVERAVDQMFDLIHLIPAVAGSWSRSYGLDMRRLKERHLRKLEARGYVKRGEEAA